MYPRKILNKVTEGGVFDVARILHYYFPNFSSQRIYELILQVDSIDLALDCLFMLKDKPEKLNETVYSILHYRDNS